VNVHIEVCMVEETSEVMSTYLCRKEIGNYFLFA